MGGGLQVRVGVCILFQEQWEVVGEFKHLSISNLKELSPETITRLGHESESESYHSRVTSEPQFSHL